MTPKRKILITVLCLFGSLVVALVFGIIPLVQGISKDAQKLQAQKRTLDIFTKEAQEIENFKAFSQERQQDLENLSLLFVSPETPISLIEFVEESSLPFRLEPKIVPGEPQQLKGDAWPSLEFRISSKAPYPEAFAFLKAIENAPFAIELKNITLTAEQNSRDVEFTFALKAYTK